MNVDVMCERLSQSLPPLFECAPAPREGVRVRTPLLFPDGGVIDVFVLERDGAFTITDFGDAVGWLELQSYSRQRTVKQRALIEDTCHTLGIEVEGSQLTLKRVLSPNLADAVLRMAQAEARVADVWFTTRQSPWESTVDDVEVWLKSRSFDVERGYRIAGRSNRNWDIDFRTKTVTRESWVFVLSTGTRGATRRILEHVVTGWYDLRHLRSDDEGLGRISLFDDRADVWTDEDFGLVEEQSTVARWTRPDELEKILSGGNVKPAPSQSGLTLL